MAAAVRYQKARFAVAAVVAAGVIGGTAYFAGVSPAEGSSAGSAAAAVVNAVTGPAPSTIRQSPALPAPAKRSRGS